MTTLHEDLRRKRRYDDGASIETLMLLDEAADAIETFEARQKTAMQFDDPGGTLVWSPAEMVDLLQTMAQSADRRTLSFSEAASIARGAAEMIRRLAQPIPRYSRACTTARAGTPRPEGNMPQAS